MRDKAGVAAHDEYLTGLLPPDAEQWRVLRCEECGHLEWLVVT